jgi:hypothetical protein
MVTAAIITEAIRLTYTNLFFMDFTLLFLLSRCAFLIDGIAVLI